MTRVIRKSLQNKDKLKIGPTTIGWMIKAFWVWDGEIRQCYDSKNEKEKKKGFHFS